MTTIFSRRAAIVAVALGLGLATPTTPTLAQSRTGGSPNSMHAGLGLKGYDPVAYFTGGKARKGLESITATNAGLTWRFATVEHQKAFLSEPGKYLPQYGGFCAWGVANSKLFEIDPVEGWTITDGKLFVVFNRDILKLFKADQTALVAKAEQNWPKLNQ